MQSGGGAIAAHQGKGKDMTKLKAINAKQAYKLMDRLGLCYGQDGVTFYATNEEETEVWEFDSKAERDSCIEKMAKEFAEDLKGE